MGVALRHSEGAKYLSMIIIRFGKTLLSSRQRDIIIISTNLCITLSIICLNTQVFYAFFFFFFNLNPSISISISISPVIKCIKLLC